MDLALARRRETSYQCTRPTWRPGSRQPIRASSKSTQPSQPAPRPGFTHAKPLPILPNHQGIESNPSESEFGSSASPKAVAVLFIQLSPPQWVWEGWLNMSRCQQSSGFGAGTAVSVLADHVLLFVYESVPFQPRRKRTIQIQTPQCRCLPCKFFDFIETRVYLCYSLVPG